MRASLLLALFAGCTPEGAREFLVAPGEGGELDDPDRQARSFPYATIQEAIDAASSGDTVTVPSGSYTEDLSMKDGVTVDGAGQGETWLYGTATFPAGGSATLSSMTLIDPDFASGGSAYLNNGIEVGTGSATLSDLGIHYYLYAINADGSEAVDGDDLLLSYNWYGVVSDGTAQTDITNSLIGSNPAGGIAIIGGAGATIAHNTLLGNSFAASSAYLVGAIALASTTEDVDPYIVANNILTSNYYGIDCYDCDATWAANLVWGNTSNYINDASSSSSDVAVDPGFANAGEGDYGLAAASACIDAGSSTYGIATDRDGESRPQGDGWDMGFDEYATSDYDLLLTEVMANAATESTGEFVEIYNAGSSAVDLAGMRLTDGDETDTLVAYGSSGSTLEAGEYAVVVDPEYASGYTLDSGVTLLTTGDTEVGNGLTTSDRVTLYESDGSTVAASFTFPKDPGDGVSMEMNDLTAGDISGNWRASVCTSGSSPGAAHCFPDAGDPSELVITEVLANASDEDSGEYVEIYNNGTLEIDAGGLVLMDTSSDDTLEGFGGGSTLIGPGEHALVVDPGYAYNYTLPTEIVLLTTDDATIGNGLSTSDTVSLYDTDGTTLISSFSYADDPGDGYSMERIVYGDADAATNWAPATDSCTRGITPGRLNGSAGGVCDPLLITEVMSNALDEDTGEFIEIYNAGYDTIDLANLWIDDSDVVDQLASYGGGSTELAPGGYAVIIDAEYAGEYTLDSSALVVTTTDSHLGDGLSVSEAVYLLEPDSEHIVDSYAWPLNAGNGVSVERVAMGLLDTADNWLASTCASGSSPGADNCVASGSTSAADSTYELVITEVMANPLDEGTGEFIEVYNAGSTDIDMLYMAVWDGDSVDTVFGFTDIYDTVLPAGGYAIVLDADYAGEYTLPADTLVLTTDDATVASGLSTEDPVYLYEAGGTSLIDSYSYPSNPGNGTSVEKVDVTAGDVESNWSASACSGGSSPGSGSCP